MTLNSNALCMSGCVQGNNNVPIDLEANQQPLNIQTLT